MLLDAKDSLLVVVDIQASLMRKIIEADRMVAVTKKLISIARELSVPVVVTEHYPQGLKPTIPEVADHLGEDYQPLIKTIFSCCGDEGFIRAVKASGRGTMLLVGIETHICILQTALQLKERGHRVIVVADGVTCRSALDHEIAFRRMAQHGVEPVTWEMVAYEWMRRADTPEFKRVLPHIKAGL